PPVAPDAVHLRTARLPVRRSCEFESLSWFAHNCLPVNCCFGRHIAFLETCKCVPVLSPDWRQHRSKSQVDAFTCFGRILNLLEEPLLPDRIVECRNGLCSTGQISAQRHIQVAEFRYACL